MDELCGSPLWDYNLTWNTSDPQLTPCFEKTILVWTPCAFLWVFSFMEISYILHSKDRNIPWNFLNLIKLFITSLLLVLTLVDLGFAVHKSSGGEDVPDVEYYSPMVKIISFCFSGVLLFYNRRYGLRTSGLLFLFWFLLLVSGIPQFRSELIRYFNEEYIDRSIYPFVSFMIYFPLVFIMLILNCFVDAPPSESPYKTQKNPCPERNSSYLSRILFAWFDPLAWVGFRRPLVIEDLWSMNPEDSSAEVVPLFDKYWNKSLKKFNDVQPVAKASYTKSSGNVDFGNTKAKKQASILPALCKAFGPTFAFGSFLKFTQDVMTFISPQILSLLISFVENGEHMWKGFLYAVLLFGTAVIQTLVLSQYFHRMFLVGLRIRTALISAIYRKALRLSNSARKESTVGEIVNLMSVDAQRFMDLTAYLNMIWSAPLQITLALYFLWRILGPSVLAGLAVMIILIPVNGFIANRVKTLQIKQMKNKDERVKLMNEVLNGIKVLKLYAWEPSFEAQILKIRNREIKVLKQSAYLNAATSFIWSCAPFLVTILTLITYCYVDDSNVLTPQKAFVSLTLFNIMYLPINLLPILIVYVVETAVSVKRLNKFMNAEELDPTSTEHDKSEINPLVIENGRFSWGSQEPTLHNINISIPSGSLVAIVGSVGSGKSSLLSAFLGEMDKITGRVNTYGSIAYVSQQAWIQNCTLQDNILFGKSLDKTLYNSVVDACALKQDLDMLPGGDQTEIGEKGINLSGGQKQRVSLARAVYCDNDVYFLDDPLSAVDSHVGKHIFEHVIGPSGILKKKTRLLVTHGITYLPGVDNIIVLKDGHITETGTYKELLAKKGAFADFLLQHLNKVSDQGESELIEIKQQLEHSLGSTEFLNKLQRARSLSESASETNSEQKSPYPEVKKLTPEKTPEANNVNHKEKAADNKLIEAEKAETGSVKWRVYSHYLVSIGLFLSIATIVMNLIFQSFSIGSNVWLSIWSTDKDLVVNGTNDPQKRDMYLGVYGALGIGQALVSFFGDLAPLLGCWMAAKLMHDVMLNGIMKAPLNFFDTTPSGRILARFSKDIDVLDTSLPREISDCIYCVYEVIATLVVISISTPTFIGIIIPIGFVYYFIQRFYVATSRQLKRLESVSRSPIYSHFGESVTGASTIRAYGIQDRFMEESEDKVDYNQVCYYPSIIANRWLAVRLEMIGNLIILFSALFAVLGRDSINPGLVGLSVSYALQITQTLNWLVRMTSEVETNIVAVERIKEYGETAQEAPWEISETAPKADWPLEGQVTIEKLVMRYRSTTEPVLHGVSCEVKSGEKIGIVGRTGAGKSTLTLALFRIVEPHSGRILIDGIDISKLGLHALRSRLTIIPQDPVLFSGSLRTNLDPFDIYSDDAVWRALEHAHLKAFVKGLAAGLNHTISEGGENLSVGQRQLVCLARALLRKTRLLILDEATAAVDLETDDLIQRTIRTEFASCTVLTIAHRLNTIMDSNRVLVLDKGNLAEFDSPEKLLENKKSIFYGMAKDAGLVN
ncbi:multidrug-Resistance like Protein 1 isoform X3 [Arctopsyche grandis]|uniref:multidrug-Resistance like Protein 1 isoform X3 n=1 Tax=Arctopsyche grandis TaxID=121162 RepID=UPI00406D6F53